MGISWNNRTIADARLTRIYGGRMAGGYVLRLGVDFDVLNWDEAAPPPIVIVAPARVCVQGQTGMVLGWAYPEVLKPFTVSQYASKLGVLFDLPLTQQAMEALERHRSGLNVSLSVKLQAEVRCGVEVQPGWADLTCTFNLSQWLEVLDQAGYGRTLLFEVPIPTEPAGLGSAIEHLEVARRFLVSGHHSEVVAKCRMVLERLTQELNEEQAFKAARDSHRTDRTAPQRELLMRQAALDFSHLAHHPTGTSLHDSFDRNAAQMMLGVTAALVSSAMARNAASRR